ncbi:hypothetical protein A2154_03355 [Candidatus Gottesmanbacteria bacterium RBG_16_43_7]|uniref:Vitamin K epoxide reductase domain-containing protein n=1 Tax=Candidatus Gottesmanbacteria bacterium RBG_16_43_7 TaxID=1798373 RepID=A0A1F5Z9A4_9BACT|nr:MAG: hypothetical protein A2154_03355 [Candidatus Gottesmanbacteria bacterium RBG_16_43_7]
MGSNKTSSVTINRIIFILSLAGMLMAIYVLQSFLRQSSIICLTGGGCEVVRNNPVSYPFGIPVPAFGLLGYLGLTILSFLRSLNQKANNYQLISNLMLGIAIFGVCFVTWFTLMEIFVIKGVCSWCAISTVNMYIIFFLILIGLRKKLTQSSNVKSQI